MRVACLVSGGVDSSLALALVRESGHEVTAFYLKIWLEDEAAFLGECPWEDDLAYVRKTCELLGVKLEVVPLQREYHERVISYALEEVKRGRTPNPDVLCNSTVKFGAFLDWLGANDREFDKVATGHYARVRAMEHGTQNTEHKKGASIQLLASPDAVKDQTYFLSRLSPEQLAMAMFPIGKYTKDEVRKMARERELPSQDRPDSQGLCFLGEINYADFVRHHLGEKEGEIVDRETGKSIGKHRGHWFFTIGQRHGLDLSGGPWYVTGKDVEKNGVFVTHRLKMKDIEREEFLVEGMHWLVPAPEEDREITVKIRHGAARYRCAIKRQDGNGERLHVRLLDTKERGIAPGQFAVFYDGDLCLGSGVIVK